MTTPSPTPRNYTARLLKALTPVLVILVLATGALWLLKTRLEKPSRASLPGEGANTAQIDVGRQLPDFTLNQFGDGEVQASKLPSKVTLINFWATWCEACMLEMPSIVKLRKAYSSQGFDVAAISVDENPKAVLPATLKRLGIDFPVYVDKDQKLSTLFDIEAIPLTVIVDRNLKILYIEAGERDWNGQEIRGLLEGWLKG